MMQSIRKWMYTWVGAFVGVAAAVLFLATVTVGYATEAQVKGKPEVKPAQGQQMCSATPSAGVCQVTIDCPSIKAPGQTTCQATIDCPDPQKPVKPKKKTRSQ